MDGNNGYFLTILAGTTLTLSVALGSLLVASLLGLVGAIAKLSRNKPLVWAAETYSTVVRGVPDLVSMLLIFYGGQIGINALATAVGYEDNIDINPFVAGICTIGFIYGAYLSETFRGAIMAIPKGQSEAGVAYGMGNFRVFTRIVFPQMVRYAIPGFTNTWLVMVKATALVSIIGLKDMMYLAKQASGITRSAFTYYLFAAALYLVITTISLLLLRHLDRKFSSGVRRGEF